MTFFYRLFPLVFCCFFGSLDAQIAPPAFQCILNDTLVWQNVPDACGPFLGTRILVATDPSGPFTEQTIITDAAETRFYDPNPTGELRYYVLNYSYDCSGQSSLNSDTLSNLIPSPPSSTWVSVENNAVIIHWTPSPSPQTSGYVIAREEPQGFIIVGTVNGAMTTTFTDNSFVDPPVGVTYRVTAIDPCGNNSLAGPVVGTASLTASGGNGCNSLVEFTAETESSSNPRPIPEWTLFASVDGGPFQAVDNAADPAALTYDDANDGESICFYAEGLPQGLIDRPVRTTETCLNISITQPVRVFSLYGGSFDNGGDLTISFDWDDLAAADLLQVEFVDNNSVATTQLIDLAGVAGPRASVVLPQNILPAGPFSFSLRAEDICDNVVITNMVSPIFLSGQSAMGGTNNLSWTTFSNELATAINYQLIRVAVDGTEEVVFRGPELSFADLVGTDDANFAQSCYRVVALVDLPDGSMETFSSRVICLEQQPMIYLPNVFNPQSDLVTNQTFCPGFSRMPTGEYQLDIFDRWGGHVFSTSVPGDCWTGEWKGELAASGVYLYVLRLEIGGRMIERAGDVTLLR